MKKIAIIGVGNMGGAIAESLDPTLYSLTVTAASQASLDKIAKVCPAAECSLSNASAVKDADFIVLAVKPYVAPGVIDEIKGCLKSGATVISVVAARSVESLSKSFDAESNGLKIVRVIPNTAIRLGKSVTFISAAPGVDADTLAEVTDIFNRSGKAYVIPEKDMAACCSLSSCGIAFFLRFIRAAAEGAVELGMKPAFATEVAAYTAQGAGALLFDGSHPEAEIDKVTTPGGITIKGLNEMENKGFTAAVIAAVKASMAKE
ncbi:MAG: pyrroline-5-carboxylate reductase [Muribaculaceae bacterium]